jgi:hypothetical protein
MRLIGLFLVIVISVVAEVSGNHLNAGFYDSGITRNNDLMAEIGVVPAGIGEERVSTEEGVRRLIPAVIAPELKGVPFVPALNDRMGAFRALAVLIPRAARIKLVEAEERRSTAEIARFVQIPEFYVDIWLRHGTELEKLLMPELNEVQVIIH